MESLAGAWWLIAFLYGIFSARAKWEKEGKPGRPPILEGAIKGIVLGIIGTVVMVILIKIFHL